MLQRPVPGSHIQLRSRHPHRRDAWEALGAIGETLGAVAVFVTLGYLAVPVGHAREEVRRSTSRARSEARRDALAIVADARTLPLIVKAEVAEGGGVSPFHGYAMTHWGMTREEAAFLLMSLASTSQTRLQLIAYLDDLSPHERHEFEERSVCCTGSLARPSAITRCNSSPANTRM
jgi:hypothetical protein